MRFFTKTILLIISFGSCFSLPGFGEKTHIIEFNSEGIMTAAPPLVLPTGDKLKVQINIESKSFEKRIFEAMERYLTVMSTINSDGTYNLIDNNPTALDQLRCDLGKQIETISNKYLNADQKAIINQRLTYLNYSGTCSSTTLAPDLNLLIKPSYKVVVSFMDGSGNKISGTQNLNFTITLPNSIADFSILSSEVAIVAKTAEVRFELREENLLNQLILKEAAKVTPTQLQLLGAALKNIKTNLNAPLLADYNNLKEKGEAAVKYLKNPRAGGLDKKWIKNSNDLLKIVESSANKALGGLRTPALKNWFLSWMWLTEGIPQTNPINYQKQPLFGTSSNSAKKVTEQEKALVELFDNMVGKGGFQIGLLPETTKENQMDRIADIKARLKLEGTVTAISNEYDILLYSGLMKSFDNNFTETLSNEKDLNFFRSNVPVTYMLSHDAVRNYNLMSGMQKEIKEIDQLVVALQNKKPADAFKLELIPTDIANDASQITEEINRTIFADVAVGGIKPGSIPDDVLKFLVNYDRVMKKMEFLLSLQAAPKLPLLLTKDETPTWKTEILNYNQVIHAPSIAEYKIKSVSGTDEKEVYKGQFRVNKLYNLRFKAGPLYSSLEQTDYTQGTSNTFTQTRKIAGIDGTFGLQVFPIKTDVRQINISKGGIAPFLYFGLSMKNIKENFYPGLGLEIFSGLSIAYTRHVSSTEVLTGIDGMPQRIENKWIGGNSISILVDGSLFVNLFKFGSNKNLLGF